MKTQDIINILSKKYDDGEMTRADVWYELEKYIDEGHITTEIAQRLFDIIV